MMAYQPDVLIYHDNCDDGFACAWIAYRKWGDAVQLVPTNYGLPLPPLEVENKRILVADFSLTHELAREIAEQGAQIVMLDHHRTAEEQLSRLHRIHQPTVANIDRFFERMFGTWRENVLVEFDMERSGARMMWDFCYPDEDAPQLIKIIEDRDLWRWKYEDTQLVSLYLRSLPRDIAAWNNAVWLYEHHRTTFLGEAGAIKRYHDARVAGICDLARVEVFEGYEGVVLTHICPYDYVSDVCHELLRRHPEAPFAVAVLVTRHGRTYSLRSTDDRVDVSEIAKRFGGGGHRNAAGFKFERDA